MFVHSVKPNRRPTEEQFTAAPVAPQEQEHRIVRSIEDYQILDHGYLKFIESWGSDERIVEAARMSTGKGFLGWGSLRLLSCHIHGEVSEDETEFSGGTIAVRVHRECGEIVGRSPETGDEKLLRYLWENRHFTPFEMAGLTIEVQAPIFVFREWHRHRVPFSYNEMSARYAPLPDLNYIPTIERLMMSSKSNKQAGTIKGAEEMTEESAEWFRESLRLTYEVQEGFYQTALNRGVPKELARVHLPVGRYSRMRASANLRGWLAFLTLRMAPNAQWEIRQYANAVGELISKSFPRTWSIYYGQINE